MKKNPTALNDTGSDPVDIHVGARIRRRRTHIKLSQEKLAGALGLTFQQVQKYESGANRVGASRLYEIGKVLNVPVAYFFEGLGPEHIPAGRLVAREDEAGAYSEIEELVDKFAAIPNPGVRKIVLDMIRNLAEKDGEQK